MIAEGFRISDAAADLQLAFERGHAGLGGSAGRGDGEEFDLADAPLAQELRRVLNEIRLGATRPQALRGFARRAGKGDVATSIEMIVQSETLGTELSSILSEQAQTARAKAMQEVEKKALQAPVKMILPMAVFIFPSILGVLVGPLFISYLQQK